MKALVTGSKGQLGSEIAAELIKRGHEVVGVDAEEMDITNSEMTTKTITEAMPDIVVHCAAWTAVDDAEDAENLAAVTAVNVEGTRNIANACKNIDCAMMYITTDYVYDGHGETPWDADDRNYAPLNVYGKSKLDGEFIAAELLSKLFIVRIEWVFGKNGGNFVKTMLNIGKKYPEIRVVCDQIGTPTYAHDLARLLADMAETDKYGNYNATNEGGFISWYDFACEIFREAGYDTRVVPVSTEEYGLSKAKRPLNSRLDKSKLCKNGFELLPDWHDALKRYLKEIGF